MDEYELTVVMSGKTTSAKKKSFSEKLEKLLKATEGPASDKSSARQAKIKVEKDWGEIELSYKIKKETNGAFLHFVLELDKSTAKMLAAKLRSEEEVVRYLLIRKEK